MRPTLLCTLLLLALGADLRAQELSLVAGQLKVNEKDDRSFAAAVAYTHPVGDYAALSLTYLNEGHPQDHHRDGVAGQLWLRSKRPEQGLQLGVGAGRMFYFDTATASDGYNNDHGWAQIYSVVATWHFRNRWFAQFQANRVSPSAKDSTTSLLVGAGYHFDGVRGSKLHLSGPSADDTVTVSLGQAINNSMNSETARSASVEYRRAISPYIDWTVTWLEEGEKAGARRGGLATQAWLIRSLNDKIELGMGAGPYSSRTRQNGDKVTSLDGLVSIAARYHINQRLVGQLSWNRVVTDYHRDADVLLLGLGAAF